MASRDTSNALETCTAFNSSVNAERLKDLARRELGETEELKKECLQQLRKLIKDNNVVCIPGDDFLLRFLRTRRFDVKRSFETLRNYAKHRVTVHKRLLNLQPETLRTVAAHNIVTILPYRDTEHRLLVLHRSGIWNPHIVSEEEAMVLIIVLMDFIVQKQSSQIIGASFIHDVKYIPFAHIPVLLRHLSFFWSFFFESLPIKYSVNHVVNESSLLKYVLRLIDPFIPKEIKEMMLIHGESRDVFFQHIAPTILPNDLGGSLGPLGNNKATEELCRHLKKMKDEQRYFFQQNIS